MRLGARVVALLALILGVGGFVTYELAPWKWLSTEVTAGSASHMRTEMIWIESGDQRHRIQAEIAGTERDRQIGLMFRKSLADDSGMLFIYPKVQEISMWMENTYVPLDMLFLNADGTVHSIARDAEPLSRAAINSDGPVKAVLELKAGTASRLGLIPGNRVHASELTGP